jgi:PST family polysaccharide transporter
MANPSYTQILKSSSLIGGAQGINLLLGMVRVKFAAVLIGPVGVGLIGNYTAIQGLVGTVAGLGIQSSGVREVAAAVGQGDPEAIGRTIITLRRVPAPVVAVSWRESFHLAGGLVRLGLVFMWNGLAVAVVAYLTSRPRSVYWLFGSSSFY